MHHEKVLTEQRSTKSHELTLITVGVFSWNFVDRFSLAAANSRALVTGSDDALLSTPTTRRQSSERQG
jgi:hypothetical protein